MLLENYPTVFSKNLRYILEKEGKRQIDLAKELNISKSTVSSWCCGTRLPRLNKLETIAKYFDIDDPVLLLKQDFKNFL